MLRGVPGATAPGASVYAACGCGAGQRWYSRVRHKTRRMVFPLVCIGLRVRQLPAPSLPPSCTHNTRRGCLRGSHTAARPSTCHTRRGIQAHTREKVRLARGFQRPIREKVRPTQPRGCWSAKLFAQHGASSGLSAEKLAQQAQKRQNWGIFSALGELFRAHTHIKPRGANYFALAPTSSRAGRTISRTGRSDLAALKPMTPLQPLMHATVKPPSPLLTLAWSGFVDRVF